jgi:hypothetical protein
MRKPRAFCQRGVSWGSLAVPKGPSHPPRGLYAVMQDTDDDEAVGAVIKRLVQMFETAPRLCAASARWRDRSPDARSSRPWDPTRSGSSAIIATALSISPA